MNTPQHEWLNNTPFSDDIWLGMLVDGELSVSQREAYVAHIAETKNWQKLAIAFLDEQILTAHVVEPFTSAAEVVVAESAEPKPSRGWLQYLAMAACLLIGVMLGPWLQNSEVAVEVVDVPVPSEPTVVEADDSADDTLQASLPGLYQVSDTAEEAVYYADFSVPQFMLDALVLAGHRVTFDVEFLGYTETSDNPAAVPINVIHIQKYGRLLAALQ